MHWLKTGRIHFLVQYEKKVPVTNKFNTSRQNSCYQSVDICVLVPLHLLHGLALGYHQPYSEVWIVWIYYKMINPILLHIYLLIHITMSFYKRILNVMDNRKIKIKSIPLSILFCRPIQRYCRILCFLFQNLNCYKLP